MIEVIFRAYSRAGVVLDSTSAWGNLSLTWDPTLAISTGPIKKIRLTPAESIVHVDEGVPCSIGSRVGVGHRAVLHGCTIEDDCLVGVGAILLNRVVVGNGSVIAAGALLPEGTVVPAGSLVMGMPARVVRPVDDRLRARIRSTWGHYVAEARRHRSGEIVRHPNTLISDM